MKNEAGTVNLSTVPEHFNAVIVIFQQLKQ